jgi:hypothetical protein
MGPGYISDDYQQRDFDELLGGTLNQRGYLGTALDGQQTEPRISGTVLYRDFQFGRVWLNVRGSSAVTIDMTGYSRLNSLGGYYGSSPVNNGASGGSYSLPGGDAIVGIKL